MNSDFKKYWVALRTGASVGLVALLVTVPGSLQLLRVQYGILPVKTLLTALLFAWFLFYYSTRTEPGRIHNGALTILFLAGVLMCVWAFPALMVYWNLHPDTPKKAIRIAVFFVSTGAALIYYVNNADELPKIDQKVTFFTGVCLFPQAVVEILF